MIIGKDKIINRISFFDPKKMKLITGTQEKRSLAFGLSSSALSSLPKGGVVLDN
jgi:hypothetical protein